VGAGVAAAVTEAAAVTLQALTEHTNRCFRAAYAPNFNKLAIMRDCLLPHLLPALNVRSRQEKKRTRKVFSVGFLFFDFQNWFRKPAGGPLGEGGSVETIAWQIASSPVFNLNNIPKMGP
jgi:hypothetical protein